MNKTQIDKMVDRFLAWPLPKDFAPDCGISFKREPDAKGHAPTGPVGTNLFTADQARQMFEHCLSNEVFSVSQQAELKELLSLERQYSQRLGEMARLSDTVCTWVLEHDNLAEESPEVKAAAEEIMEYVEAVRPDSDTSQKDQPLRCFVRDHKLVISIGVDTLAFADKQRTGHKINNALGFAEDVARMLQDEDEVGATLLTELLDNGMQAAVEDGTEFVDYEEFDEDMEREY